MIITMRYIRYIYFLSPMSLIDISRNITRVHGFAVVHRGFTWDPDCVYGQSYCYSSRSL